MLVPPSFCVRTMTESDKHKCTHMFVSRRYLRPATVGGLSRRPASASTSTTDASTSTPLPPHGTQQGGTKKSTPSVLSLLATASQRTAAAATAAAAASTAPMSGQRSRRAARASGTRPPMAAVSPSTTTTAFADASPRPQSEAPTHQDGVTSAGFLPPADDTTRLSLLPLARKLHRNVKGKRIPWHVLNGSTSVETEALGGSTLWDRWNKHTSGGGATGEGAEVSSIEERRVRAAHSFLSTLIAPLPAIPRSHHLDQILMAAANEAQLKKHTIRAMAAATRREGRTDAKDEAEDIIRVQVSGATGCGKSVVVPLKLADHHWRQLQLRLEATFPELLLPPDNAAPQEKGHQHVQLSESKLACDPSSSALKFDTSSKEMFVQSFARESRIRIVVSQPTRIACVQLAHFVQTVLDAFAVIETAGSDESSSMSFSSAVSRTSPPPPAGGDARTTEAAAGGRRSQFQYGAPTLRRVGYAVANDLRATPGAEIVFATPQYLLNTLTLSDHRRSLTSSGDAPAPSLLENPTDIILDEVHRRDLFTDMLLLWCRQCIGVAEPPRGGGDTPIASLLPLRAATTGGGEPGQLLSVATPPPASTFHRRRLRSIMVMSATSDTSLLSQYLNIPLSHGVTLSSAASELPPEAAGSRGDEAPVGSMVHAYPVHAVFTDTLYNAAREWRSLFPAWGSASDDEGTTPLGGVTAINDHRRNQQRVAKPHQRGGAASAAMPWLMVVEQLMQPEFYHHGVTAISALLKWSSLESEESAAGNAPSRRAPSSTGHSPSEATTSDLPVMRAPDISRVGQRIAMIAVMLATLPPLHSSAATTTTTTSSGDAHHRSRVSDPGGIDDLDEEDRVLIFVPGLSEMVTLTKSLQRIATALQGSAGGAQFVNTRSLGALEDESPAARDAAAVAHQSDGERGQEAAAISAVIMGRCELQVTLLHSSALGEVSRQLELLPQAANKGRRRPAMGQMVGSYQPTSAEKRAHPRSGRGVYNTTVSGAAVTASGNTESFRKCRLIFATSVAESSLTIPGLRAVVDCGQDRVVSADPITGGLTISTQYTNMSSLMQRRGRVGRTSPGIALHLLTQAAAHRLAQHELPESIKGSPARLVLLTKLYFDRWSSWWPRPPGAPTDEAAPPRHLNTWTDVIARFPTPPTLRACMLGAEELVTHRLTYLSRHLVTEGATAPLDGGDAAVPAELAEPHQHLTSGYLTRRGTFFAAFPLELRWATLVYYGGVFGVLHDALVLACILSVPAVFLPLGTALHLQTQAKLPRGGGSGAHRNRHVENRTPSSAGQEDAFAEAQQSVEAHISLITEQHRQCRRFAEGSSSGTSSPGGSSTMSEPLMLLRIMRHRYSLRSRWDLNAFEQSLGLNASALIAADHAVALCAQRIMKMKATTDDDRTATLTSGGLSLPVEWSHGSRSPESMRVLDQLRSAALDRLANAPTETCQLTSYAPPSEESQGDACVMHSRLTAAFVASFPTNILRAEEVPLPRRASQRLQLNADTLLRATTGGEGEQQHAAVPAVASGMCPFEGEQEERERDERLAPRVLRRGDGGDGGSVLSYDVCIAPLKWSTREWARGALTLPSGTGAAPTPTQDQPPPATIVGGVANMVRTLSELSLCTTSWPDVSKPSHIDAFPNTLQVAVSWRRPIKKQQRRGDSHHDGGNSRTSLLASICFPPLGMSILYAALRMGVFHATSRIPRHMLTGHLGEGEQRQEEMSVAFREDIGRGNAPTGVPTSWRRDSSEVFPSGEPAQAERPSQNRLPPSPRSITVVRDVNSGLVSTVTIPTPPHRYYRAAAAPTSSSSVFTLDVNALMALGWKDMMPSAWSVQEVVVSGGGGIAPKTVGGDNAVHQSPDSTNAATATTGEGTARRGAESNDDTSEQFPSDHVDVGLAENVTRLIIPGEVRWVAVIPSSTAAADSNLHHPARRRFCPVCQHSLRSSPVRSEEDPWEAHKGSAEHLLALGSLVKTSSNYLLKYASFAQATMKTRSAAAASTSMFFSMQPVSLPSTSVLSLLQLRPPPSPPQQVGHHPPLRRAAVGTTVATPPRGRALLHGTSAHIGVAATLVRHHSDHTGPYRGNNGDAGGDGDRLAAHNLWVMSMRHDAYDVLRGLVVAAASRNTVAILTDVAHRHVHAVSIGMCGVFGLETPLDGRQLAKLVALYQTGSESAAGKLMRSGQSSSAAAPAAAVQPTEPPAAAGARASASSSLCLNPPLHWCTLSVGCPMCTFVASSDTESGDLSRLNAHDLPARVADTRVGASILLCLHRLLDLRIRRTTLQEFTEELLVVLTKFDEMAASSVSSQATPAAAHPLGGLCAGDALSFFLRKRSETLQDVLVSLGCVFHVGTMPGGAGDGRVLRFYVPPMVASWLPSPQLPVLLKQLTAPSRHGAGRGRPAFEEGPLF